MPRDLPIGNGSLLIAFDSQYRLAGLYFPHVGMENHAAARFRFGVWADGALRWIEHRRWARSKALPSLVLPEQIDPYDGQPLSVAPMTWSHAQVVSVLRGSIDALRAGSVAAMRRIAHEIRMKSNGRTPLTITDAFPRLSSTRLIFFPANNRRNVYGRKG